MRVVTFSLGKLEGFGLRDEGEGWEHRNKYEFHIALFRKVNDYQVDEFKSEFISGKKLV